MASHNADQAEFEQQLRLEKEAATSSGNNDLPKQKTGADGTTYEWDSLRKAWFPKIDDDFIAMYQMNYGSSDTSKQSDDSSKAWDDYYNKMSPEELKEYREKYWKWYKDYCAYYANNPTEGLKTSESEQLQNSTTTGDIKVDKNAKKHKLQNPAAKKQPEWFDIQEDKNTQVYVSGLPTENFTDDDFKDLMSKYGLIAMDPISKSLKLKLYKNSDGKLKGDGLCCYIKKESVDLALRFLDEYQVRKGHTVSVEKAQFQLKGQYDPKKKRKQLSNKEKRKLKEKQEQLFAWKLEKPKSIQASRPKCEKTVVIRKLFVPKEFDVDPQKIQTYREFLRHECSNYGKVNKVTIYDHNSEGVATVNFSSVEEADYCVQNIHNRIVLGKIIMASNWNGKEKFDVQESSEDKIKRDEEWQRFLEQDEDDTNKNVSSTAVNLDSNEKVSDYAGTPAEKAEETFSEEIKNNTVNIIQPDLSSESSSVQNTGSCETKNEKNKISNEKKSNSAENSTGSDRNIADNSDKKNN